MMSKSYSSLMVQACITQQSNNLECPSKHRQHTYQNKSNDADTESPESEVN